MRTVMLLLLMSGAAAADSGTVIAEAAQACWSLPSGAEFETMKATLDVETDANGSVLAITVKEYSPTTEKGKVFVRSASLAIERCSPYRVPTAGKFEVNMALPADLEPIDPFKTQ